MDNKGQTNRPNEEIMTLSEVARYLKLAEKTLLRMVHGGKIPCAKIASQWRFSRTVIDDWLLSQMKVVPQNDLARLIESKPDIVPLYRIIRENLIKLDIAPGTKEEVLRQLMAPFIREGIISNDQKFLEKLMRRERMASTAIGRGIAVPHIRDLRENPGGSPLLGIGICKPGTDFEAFDGNKTHLFFLLCTDSEVVHLRVLAKITGMFRIENVLPQFLQAKVGEDVVRLVLNLEWESMPVL